MFWIGLIVGIILGLVGCVLWITRWAWKAFGISLDEAASVGVLLINAAENRESSIAMVKDDEIVEEVTLYER